MSDTRTSVTTIDPTRRRLLFALHGGAVLASPLALLACGGSGGGGSSGPDAAAESAARVAAIAARLPTVNMSAQPVRVVVPDGSTLSLDGARLATTHNVAEVAADGTSATVLFEGGAQMAYLFDKAGRLMLMGIVEPDADQRVDARSTAEALVLLASRVDLYGPAPAHALRQALRGHVLVEPVVAAVEAATSRGGIDAGDGTLMAAIDSALRVLFPRAAAGRRATPAAVRATPTEAQSGVTVVSLPEAYNTVVWRNAFRRRAHVWVDRVGSTVGGTFTPLPAPVPVKTFPLSTTTQLSFESFVTAAGDFLAGLVVDIGALDAYDAGSAPWQAVTSDPVELAVEAGATSTRYRTRIVGLGATAGGTLSTTEELGRLQIRTITAWEDVALPALRTLVLPMIASRFGSSSYDTVLRVGNDLLLSGVIDFTSIGAGLEYFPKTMLALDAGNISQALQDFLVEFFNSNVWGTLFNEMLRAWVQQVDPRSAAFGSLDIRDSSGKLVGVNLLDSEALTKTHVDQLVAGLSKVAKVIQVAKTVALGADWLAMAKDYAASSQLAEIELEASAAKLVLSPDPAVADATAGAAGKAAITAALVGLDAGLAPENVFLTWSCTHRYGDLFKRGADGTNDFESVLANPTHDYIPSGVADDPANPDTVTVVASYRNPTTADVTELARASVTVRFKRLFSLGISPAGPMDVPTDATLPIVAFIKEVLPTGATVQWNWTHGGVGSLAADPPDGDAKSSTAKLSTGSTDGSSTITVTATVNVPATATTSAVVVVTDPVTATHRVKKGTRTITFEASGGVFPCGQGCGVTDYSAFVVPRMPGAISYQAVFSGFGYGPCNRRLTWTTPLGDGGGCNFPVTYHPFQAGSSASFWAVWMGFGGPLDPGGHCLVTITLPA